MKGKREEGAHGIEKRKENGKSMKDDLKKKEGTTVVFPHLHEFSNGF